MEDATLLRIALVLSISGLAALYLISANVEIEKTGVIGEDNLDETVIVQGKVRDIRNLEGLTIFEVENTVDVVVFENLSLEPGTEIEVIGSVEEYKGEYEIIAQTIRKK